jgi:hypothetical protein
MSIQTGTATNYNDLLNKLVTFLTGMATNPWTLLAQNTTSYSYGGDTVVNEVYLKAPGLGGTQSIYVQLQAFFNTSGGYYNWRLAGASGYNSSQLWVAQPGISPFSYMPAWNNSIPYTFIANGQRVIVIAQIGTVYESCYLGLFNPYGSPSQYPYPLAIGGSANANNTVYSDSSFNHQAFFDPLSLYVNWVDGTWRTVSNRDTGGNVQGSFNVFPYVYSGFAPTWMATNLDGSYPLFAARLEMTTPSVNVVGELDGVFFTTGASLSSSSTITVGSNTYLALQNAFRTGTNNFAAILEA